jgi:hypothetical protein
LSTTTHNNLFDAVAFLAGRCDWAFHEDGVGYNKSDTGLGHFLAELPYGEWTATQRRAAWQMLRKYRRQLATGGIDYDAIPVPARPEDYYGDEASDSWVRDTAQDERRETEYARKQEVREAAERAQRVIDVTDAGLLTARHSVAALGRLAEHVQPEGGGLPRSRQGDGRGLRLHRDRRGAEDP